MPLSAMLALLLAAAPQETRALPPGAESPPATVDALAWLAGTWCGRGPSGEACDTYSAPMGGQIAGHFVELKDGRVSLMELMRIAPHGRSIAYELRHFRPDFTGWEDATGKPVRFPLVAVERDRVHFDGLTIHRAAPDAITLTVRIGTAGGTPREIAYRYRRVR